MTDLLIQYSTRRKEILIPIAEELNKLLSEYFEEFKRIDRIATRAKSIDSFIAKALKEEDGKSKYEDPLNQIQDQVGARIVTFYKNDVDRIREEILKFFRPIENKRIIPDKESEFGYFGQHLILLVPRDISSAFDSDYPPFFELQIKTLFQHAWSEANHDLGYKPNATLSPDLKRKIAFAAAQAWGADEIFNDLFSELSRQ